MLYDPLLGRVIDGKYRFDAEIGAGGMATVYRATRLHIGDTVAIKVMHAEVLREPQFAERFRREAQAAAHLKHPNVVAIYDFGVSTDGVFYLVMELIEGQDLGTIISEHGPVPAALAGEVVRQVCAALGEAHRRHVVHRDIKPGNIMVETTPDGVRVKVLDFGIASLRSDDAVVNLTQAGTLLGTPAYTSPEQCLGEELDGRSDIYSLGVVLFEMLCGALPFNSPTALAAAMQHVQQAPPPLRVLNPSISPAVEAVVLRALAKRPDDRFQNAREFADALTTAADGARPLSGATTVSTPTFSAAQLRATMVQSALDVPSQSSRPRNRLTMGITIGAALMLGFVLLWFGVQRWTGGPGLVAARRAAAVPKVVARRPASPRPASSASAIVSGTAMEGFWEIDEANVQVGTISWVGEAVLSADNTIVFYMRKRSVAGRSAVPCERETRLRLEFLPHVVAQSVPFREVNCEGTTTTGDVSVTNFFRSSRTFSGSFWQGGAKLGNFIARKIVAP